MERARVVPDASSFTAAIGACSRGDDLPAALDLLERMRSGRGPKVDVVAYGAAAAACARGLNETRALQLLKDIRQDGLRPGREMYGAVIHACARRGRWKRSLELLEVIFVEGDGGGDGRGGVAYAKLVARESVGVRALCVLSEVFFFRC